jgi:hypothetical protein
LLNSFLVVMLLLLSYIASVLVTLTPMLGWCWLF